jgi:NADH-quinone oxidoreductase subunit L
VPLWVKCAPFVMMLGFVRACVDVHPLAGDPASLAERHDGLPFLLNKWYFDELYDAIFVRPAMWLGRLLWKKGDGWSSTASALMALLRASRRHRRVVRLQTGYLYHYAFAMLIGVAALITWSMFSGGRSLMTATGRFFPSHLPAAGRRAVHPASR